MRRTPVDPAPSLRRCGACGSGALRRLFPVHGEFALAGCEECGTAWTDPPVPPEEIAAYYPPSYYGHLNVRFNRLFEALVRIFRRRRARKLREFAPRGRVLDVGCGRGHLLAALRGAGLEVQGVEFSDTAARYAREVLGIPVVVGSFVEEPFARESFDAIVFWHSLEHFPDPSAAVARGWELLRPGGLLLVAVPNLESLQARAGGPAWFHLDVPRHYSHFGLRGLERLLGRRGFEVVQVSHFNLEQNPYGWIQSLLNRAGFPENLLYEILKTDSSRQGRRPWVAHPYASLALALLLVPVAALSFGLFLLETALHRGGSVEVYATKREERPEGSDARP